MILKNKKAVITGGSGGIGRSIAELFLKEGAEVILVARGENELKETEKELQSLSSAVWTCVADVSKPESVNKIIDTVNTVWNGDIGVVVNAAGIYGPKGFLEELSEDEWLKTIYINLFGTMLVSRAVLSLMKKKREGVIINFSGGGEGAFPRFTAYAASKGGVVRFTESLAEEVRPWGIRVNSIAPGAVNTGLVEEVLKAGPEKVGQEFYENSLKQKRDGGVSSQKAAQLCVFLASDKSNGLTGRTLSAVWDNWQEIPTRLPQILESDIYTFRRIKPLDRGYDWK